MYNVLVLFDIIYLELDRHYSDKSLIHRDLSESNSENLQPLIFQTDIEQSHFICGR